MSVGAMRRNGLREGCLWAAKNFHLAEKVWEADVA